MPKVVVANLKNRTARKIGSASVSVGKKRVRDAEGRIRQLRTLDAGSVTFAADLTYVFSKNVAKARRDNKRVAGVTDVVPTKG